MQSCLCADSGGDALCEQRQFCAGIPPDESAAVYGSRNRDPARTLYFDQDHRLYCHCQRAGADFVVNQQYFLLKIFN